MPYAIRLTGQTLPGVATPEAAARLAALFKLPAEKAAALLSGQPITIKTGLDEATAEKYLAALAKAGVAATRLSDEHPPTTDTPSPQAAAPDWSIAPVGVILSETREVSPPVVDLSGLSLAEPGVILAEPTAIPEPQIDISGLKVVTDD